MERLFPVRIQLRLCPIEVLNSRTAALGQFFEGGENSKSPPSPTTRSNTIHGFGSGSSWEFLMPPEFGIMKSFVSRLGLILVLGAMPGPNLWARPGDLIPLTTLTFSMPAPTQPGDVDRALMTDLTETFKKYKPTGEASKFAIRGTGTNATVTFTIVEHVGLLPVSVNIEAVVEAPTKVDCPTPAVAGYRVDFDLSGSDSHISDNAILMRIESCVIPNDDGSLTMPARAWMREGKSFGGKSGKLTKEALRNQVEPVL